MLRNFLAAVIFIVFAFILILIEVSITLPVDSGDISHNGVNLFNRILLSIVAITIFFLEIYPYSKKINNKMHRILYMSLTSLFIIFIAIYWMISFKWK
jgi:hypothetical protein